MRFLEHQRSARQATSRLLLAFGLTVLLLLTAVNGGLMLVWWALSHLLRAIEVDFADVLAKKNATVSVRQIIRELEASQEPLWSPMVLNGSGFGMWANHSLVMANYISRANAAVIDLRQLLSQG